MLYIIRHGQTDGNLEKIKNYTDDTPLNNIGILEAIESGRYLKEKVDKFDYIYVSPTKRTLETLEHIMKSYDSTTQVTSSKQKPIIDDRLKESHIPNEVEDIIKDKEIEKKLTGHNFDDFYNISDQDERRKFILHMNKKYSGFMKKFGGEIAQNHYERTIELIDELTQIVKNNKTVKILIVCHGGTISALTRFMTNIESYDIMNIGKSSIKNNIYGEGNCIIGVYKYSNKFNMYDTITLPKKKLILISGFDNSHLKSLYDNFRPIFLLFTPLFQDESIWKHKDSNNDISLYEKLSSIGDVHIDIPNCNKSIKSNFSLKEILFDVHNDDLYKKLIEKTKYRNYGSFLELGHRKIVCIGYSTSCVYAFHFGNKYHDKCDNIVLINNRRFTKKNYEKTKERILRGVDYLEKAGTQFNKNQVIDMIHDVDNNKFDSENFKKVLNEPNERLLHDYIWLTLRKQYDSVPSKCVIPTTIYNDITLSSEYMIHHNMKDEYTKYMRNINSEVEAILEHCTTNMDRYQTDEKLRNNTDPDLRNNIKVYYFTMSKMLQDSMIKKEVIKNIMDQLGLLK